MKTKKEALKLAVDAALNPEQLAERITNLEAELAEVRDVLPDYLRDEADLAKAISILVVKKVAAEMERDDQIEAQGAMGESLREARKQESKSDERNTADHEYYGNLEAEWNEERKKILAESTSVIQQNTTFRAQRNELRTKLDDAQADIMRNHEFQESQRHQIAKLERQRDFLITELKDREDTEDGSEGPRPNEAMQMLTAYERKFGRVER